MLFSFSIGVSFIFEYPWFTFWFPLFSKALSDIDDDNGVLFAIYGALLVESLFTLVKLLFDFFGFLFKNENPLFFSLGFSFSFSWKLFKKLLLLLLIGSGFKKFNPGKELLG